jgi:hypothetical protein
MSQDEVTFDVARKRLWDELVNLHHAWDQFLKLYAHSEDRVKVLNASARSFFAGLQRLLIRDVILSISRLTDPPRSLGKANLVLWSILDDQRLVDRPQLKEQLECEIREVRDMAGPVRKHRNTYIAHLDHATAVGTSVDPLPGVTRGLVDQLIARMEAAYHTYRSQLDETDVSFELSALGDVDQLASALEGGQQWREHERAERRRRYGLDPGTNGAA